MQTKFLAKLIGLWVLLAVSGMMLDKPATIEMLNAFFASTAMMWVTGVFTLLLGLAVILVHNRWSGGPPTVIVTVYGWIALVKGLLFVWFPVPAQADFFRALHFEQYYYGYLSVALFLGAYLTYAGFRREGV